MSDSDNDDTPEIHRTPHGPLDPSNDPSVYLQRPSHEGHVLGAQVGLHNGAAVPWWMVAEVALRLERAWTWITARTRIERALRRRAGAALATVAANIALIVGYAYHRAEESGAERERTSAQERASEEHRRGVRTELDRLERDIRELREKLLKMTYDAHKSDITIARGNR